MFGSLFSSKPRSEIALILDLGSGSAGASLVRLSPNEKPKVFFTLREPLPVQKHLHPDRLLAHLEKALERTLHGVQKEGLSHMREAGEKSGTIDEVYVVLNSPWYLSETKILSLTPLKPALVTRELIDGMIKAEEESFEERDGAEKKDTTPIERSIMEVRLNGYPVREPYGKRAAQIELSLFLSYTETSLIERVRTLVRAKFSPKKLGFLSSTFAAFTVISDAFSPEKDFLLADVSREVTDVSLIKKGVLLETYTFPIGKNYLIRHAADQLGLEPDMARGALTLSENGKNSGGEEKKIAPLILEVEKAWTKAFAEAAEELSGNHYLPADLYLISQSDFLPFFKKAVEKIDTSVLATEKQAPLVHVLGQNELKELAEYVPGVDADTFLTLGIAAVHGIVKKQNS